MKHQTPSRLTGRNRSGASCQCEQLRVVPRDPCNEISNQLRSQHAAYGAVTAVALQKEAVRIIRVGSDIWQTVTGIPEHGSPGPLNL